MKHDFDVIIVGGGHAGVEAALASSRMGARTCLVTHRVDRLGEMSCNPAIGGLGKGHLVREIDALDGVMARAADFAGIQFRLLNRRKGPAVQGPRTQADRDRYRRYIRHAVLRARNLTTIESEATSLAIEGGRVTGLGLADGRVVSAASVVLTTGTFLNGRIFVGKEPASGGRMGDAAVIRLAEQIRELGLPMGRLKTGTPPRIARNSIDWSKVERQYGDDHPTLFSFMNKGVSAEQVWCGVTNTNPATHSVIEANLSESAMYGGAIEGVGPRYCPSIEDKIVRFGDRSGHQIFLEPETITGNVIYPNGISTSLPLSVQERFIATIAGLESAKIVQPGYAIEYDYINPQALGRDLQLGSLPGLYLAGQINGTTGYEEAAAQGLLAGLNAAAVATGREAVQFARGESYIGVLVDDLTTRGVTEPYRMFTSRAEYRLHLRADNADQRLTPRGIDIGCVGDRRRRTFEAKMEQLDALRSDLAAVSLDARAAANAGIRINADGARRTGLDLLGYPDVSMDTLAAIWPAIGSFPDDIRQQAERDGRYANYIDRQQKDVDALVRDEAVKIPVDLVFVGMPGLSSELAQKLERVRPESIGQAARIEGMTPAALSLILVNARKQGEARRVS